MLLAQHPEDHAPGNHAKQNIDRAEEPDRQPQRQSGQAHQPIQKKVEPGLPEQFRCGHEIRIPKKMDGFYQFHPQSVKETACRRAFLSGLVGEPVAQKENFAYTFIRLRIWMENRGLP
jgi:hypothetical protein